MMYIVERDEHAEGGFTAMIDYRGNLYCAWHQPAGSWLLTGMLSGANAYNWLDAETAAKIINLAMQGEAAQDGTTSQRSGVCSHPPHRPGWGSDRTWSRTIMGKRYSFNAVLMPDGERRYFASRLDGIDSRWACNWKRAGFWTFPVSGHSSSC